MKALLSRLTHLEKLRPNRLATYEFAVFYYKRLRALRGEGSEEYPDTLPPPTPGEPFLIGELNEGLPCYWTRLQAHFAEEKARVKAPPLDDSWQA